MHQYSYLFTFNLRYKEGTIRYSDVSFLNASLADPLWGRKGFVLRTGAGEDMGDRWVTLSTTLYHSVLHQEEIQLAFISVVALWRQQLQKNNCVLL